jgi:hypothetical protein
MVCGPEFLRRAEWLEGEFASHLQFIVRRRGGNVALVTIAGAKDAVQDDGE